MGTVFNGATHEFTSHGDRAEAMEFTRLSSKPVDMVEIEVHAYPHFKG